MSTRSRFVGIVVPIAGAVAVSCEQRKEAAPPPGSGDPARGRQAIAYHGCGSCHTIPGVRGADALVGPSLGRLGGRAYLGGVLPNTKENLVRWIVDPPAVDPHTAMPNLH